MRQCNFCERWFRNKQSVRSHLKACSNYKHALASGHVTRREWRFVSYYQCPECSLPGAEGISRRDMARSDFPRGIANKLCCPLCLQTTGQLVPMALVERRREPAVRAA